MIRAVPLQSTWQGGRLAAHSAAGSEKPGCCTRQAAILAAIGEPLASCLPLPKARSRRRAPGQGSARCANTSSREQRRAVGPTDPPRCPPHCLGISPSITFPCGLQQKDSCNLANTSGVSDSHSRLAYPGGTRAPIPLRFDPNLTVASARPPAANASKGTKLGAHRSIGNRAGHEAAANQWALVNG